MAKRRGRRGYGGISVGSIVGTGASLLIINTVIPLVPLRVAGRDFGPLVQTSANLLLMGNLVRKMPPGIIKTVAKTSLTVAGIITGINLIRSFLPGLQQQAGLQ